MLDGMGKLLEVIRRIYSALQPRKGQCLTCRATLHDDSLRWCSDECYDAYRDVLAN